MRLFSSIIILSMAFITGCATTKAPTLDERFPDRVEVDPPNRIPYIEQEIDIKSMEPIEVGKQTGLHIKGTMPNLCTKILRVDNQMLPEILNLNIVGWKKYQETCAQSIKPFSYIFTGLTKEQWEQIKLITINGKEFKFSSSLNQ